jgi:protein-S-isoprenylcysteine O-methyltransferase Ste14
VNRYAKAGTYLFRYRAAIAAGFFIALIFFAAPVSWIIPHVSILIGIGLRLWAAGYIGPQARKREFHADRVIKNGPYKLFKHPLYIGNFFLVLGVVLLYNPPVWLGFVYMTAFVGIYTMIAIGERQYLRGKSETAVSYRLSNLKGEVSTLIVLVIIYTVWFLLISRV